MVWYFLLLLIGLAFLISGAEGLVRSSSKIAKMFNIHPLLIGLTVVAYGTSSPELFVSSYAAILGETEIALSNVFGSNIFNLLFILGASSLVTPLTVHKQLFRFDIPFMIFCSFILWGVLFWISAITKWVGMAFLILLVIYTWQIIKMGRKEREVGADIIKGTFSWKSFATQISVAVFSLGLLIVGSDLFVKGAVQLADLFGMSERVIGLTLVAAGTSLPEAATSIIAAIKKEKDIALGNIVGSNVFNILGVLGVSACLSSNGLSIPLNALHYEIPLVAISTIICLPLLFSDFEISRKEGALLVIGYGGYVAFLM